jgi:hypothetical protein
MIGHASQQDGLSSAPRVRRTGVLPQGDTVAGSAPAIADGPHAHRVSPARPSTGEPQRLLEVINRLGEALDIGPHTPPEIPSAAMP